MASSRPPHVDPDDRLPTSSVRYSVYLFGRLTNQWCHLSTFVVKPVVLLANTAMIVRCHDESIGSDDAFPANGQPAPPRQLADLSKVTGLSKQTTSEVIDAFEQQGLVHPIGRTSGNVGRTAVLYELSPEGGHVLGIDLGARRLTVALADIAGRVLAEADEPTDSRGGAWVLDQIARLSDRLARANHTHPSRIRSIVLATPGVVNPKSGAIEMAPNITGLGHLNVVGLLGEKLGSPVVFENDINLALLGEIWHGCAQNVANVAL